MLKEAYYGEKIKIERCCSFARQKNDRKNLRPFASKYRDSVKMHL